MRVLVVWHSDLIFYTLQNDHHSNIITICHNMKLLQYFSIFPWLYITSQWLTYFTTGSLYLIISFIYFTTLPTHTHSDKHQIDFCIYACAFIYLFVLSFSPYIHGIIWYLSFSDLFENNVKMKIM